MHAPTNDRPTILLTGGTGQVGHELVPLLAPLARLWVPRSDELDLRDPASIRAGVRAARPVLVVNAGAYTAVDRAESEPEVCAAVNAVAPGVLAAEVSALGGAMIHFSTDYVFDGTRDGAYREDDAPNPINVYGRTKAQGEAAVAAEGLPHLTFRTSWVYGLHGHNFLRTMLRLARDREEIRVVADQVGTPTWSRSLARAVAEVIARALRDPQGPAEALRPVSGVYHLTGIGATSWHGFAEAILSLDPRRSEHRCRTLVAIPSSEYPTPARRPANSVLDCGRASRELGLRLPPWREQLAEVMAGLEG